MKRRIVEQLCVAAAALLVLLLSSHLRSTPYNNYVRVADAVLHGHLWIDYPGRWLDAVEYRGRHYGIDAPFPVLLLLPLVAIAGPQANQTGVAIAVAVLALVLAHAILFELGVARAARLFLLLFLFAGTDLWWCAQLGDVWFLAHLCALAAVLGALLELCGRRRGWLVGLLGAAAFFSRNSELFALGLFAWLLVSGELARAELRSRGADSDAAPLHGARDLRAFVTVLALGALAWFGYNEALWGTPLDIGHTLYYHADSWGQKDGSPFRATYLPYQIYSFLLRPPVLVEYLQQAKWPYLNVDPHGVALTFTSPALALAFLARRPRRLVLALWLTSALVALPNLLYYMNGWYQFGMRHALDFEPFLFVLMALAVRERMPAWGAALCVYSAVAGAWGVWWWNTFMRTAG